MPNVRAANIDAAPRTRRPEPEDASTSTRVPLIDVREVTPTDFLKGIFSDCMWVRSTTPLGDDPLLHRAGLTYLSDLGSGFGQHGRELIGRGGPSIDHAMWFQENIRADEWVLLDLDPIKAGGARGSVPRVATGPARARSAPPSTRSISSSLARSRRCSSLTLKVATPQLPFGSLPSQGPAIVTVGSARAQE